MPGDQTIESEIGHLDFPVEEPAPKKNVIHWGHPTMSTLTWCGQAVAPGRYTGAVASPASEIDCVACLRQAVEKGTAWWWRVHNLFYGSTCSPNRHNCGR